MLLYVQSVHTYVIFVQMETAVDDIADVVGKLRHLSNVKLLVCCGELVKGMLSGLRRNDCLAKLAITGECVVA